MQVRDVVVGGTALLAVYVDGVLRSEVTLSELRPWGVASDAGKLDGLLETSRNYTVRMQAPTTARPTRVIAAAPL